MPVGFFKRVFSSGSVRRDEVPVQAAARSAAVAKADAHAGSVPRKSMGLSHFLANLPPREHLELLDLGGVCESNVNFLSQHGCRIHTLDLLSNFDHFREELPSSQIDQETAAKFVEKYLRFPPEHFDVMLVWDCLEHIESPALDLVVTRLAQVLRPGGLLLAFFHAQSRGDRVEVLRYEIQDEQTLRLRPRQERLLPATFNNRGLENLFGGFGSVKFFLTRDHLREVIVVR